MIEEHFDKDQIKVDNEKLKFDRYYYDLNLYDQYWEILKVLLVIHSNNNFNN